MNTPRPCRATVQSGFTLVEALVALLVMAFGMLAIAGFQITMSRNSDLAKQRSEAVRLGQLKIEELRSYETILSDGTKYDFVNEVVGGNDTVLPAGGGGTYVTNTTYTRSWALLQKDGVTPSGGADHEKWLNVLVGWTDRAGEPQSVALRSIIARAEPAHFAELFGGRAKPQNRTPRGRDIGTPHPAVSLGGGKSGFVPPGVSSQFYVFDDLTGDVVALCTGTPSFGVDISACASEAAYLLTGFVRFLATVPSTGTERAIDDAISNPTTDTLELTVNLSFVGGTPSVAPVCFAERQKTVRIGSTSQRSVTAASRSGGVVTITTGGSHGFTAGQFVAVNTVVGGGFNGVFELASASGNTFTYNQGGGDGSATSVVDATASLVQEVTIPELDAAPPGYTTLVSRFVAYACIVTPVDDGDATTRDKWSGQLVLTPTGTPIWSLGTAAGTYKVCRFTGDYRSDDLMSNGEHPLYYRGVTGALDNQNYLVLPHGQNCAVDSEPNPLAEDYVNSHTILHQNTSTGSAPFGGLLSQGTQWGGAGSGEPASNSDEIPML